MAMNTFFARYKSFTPDPSLPLLANFDLLVASQNWAPGGRARTKARRLFRNAMIEEFNAAYGIDAASLESWQNLCRVVGCQPVPETITQCKKAVRKTHVNLVDLVEVGWGGVREIRIFGSLRELREYTRVTGKYFPKNPAKEGGILKALLRDMAVKGPGADQE